MQFQYNAINNENKKLSGFINASSEEDARNQLNDLGLAVLSMEEVAEKDTAKEQDKLKFEALDKNGKKIIGTIPEKDRSKAFRRLTEEYNFQVLALYPLDATEEEKETSRAEVEKVRGQYEVGKAEEEVDTILTDEEKNIKEKLLKEADFVIQKVDEILAGHSEEIKPAEVKNIEAMKDKLLRLKSSNNLNFIKQTCEELLKKVQNKEIYIHQDRFVQERERIKLETQKLLMEVHKLDTDPDIDLFAENSKVGKVKEKLFKKKEEPEAIKQVKTEIKEVNGQIFDYRRIWLTASKTMKPEVKAKIRELKGQKMELKAKLKALMKEKKLQERATKPPTLEADLITVTGWLLTFYLAYYFINYYLTFKTSFLNENFNFQSNIFSSPVFTYLILGVFLLHITLQTRRFFIPHGKIFNIISYPTLVIVLILININF